MDRWMGTEMGGSNGDGDVNRSEGGNTGTDT